MSEFTLSSADSLRRAVGDLARVVRGTEETPDSQVDTLGFLARDGAQSIACLARRRQVRHQSMSAVIIELEARGLVERAEDPADGRGVLIALTTAGYSLISDSRARRSRAIQRAAEKALSAEERMQLANTAGLLEKLVEELAKQSL